jgi:hypothetical protein
VIQGDTRAVRLSTRLRGDAIAGARQPRSHSGTPARLCPGGASSRRSRPTRRLRPSRGAFCRAVAPGTTPTRLPRCRGPRRCPPHRTPAEGGPRPGERRGRSVGSPAAARSRPMLVGSFTIASSFIPPGNWDKRARPRRRCAPATPPTRGIRWRAPASRASGSPRAPQGCLRREVRPPRARRCQHARVAHRVQARGGGTLVASRHNSDSGSMSTATVPSL